jgi:lysophospholipase L1-like esterase
MKKFWYLLLPSLALCLLVGVGYAVGVYTVAGRFEKTIQWVEQGETLAGVLAITPLNDEQRDGIRRAYSNPDIDTRNISWSVPNQPTPFVGTAPAPGQHHNAKINAWQMRNSEDVQLPKPTGVYRIFLTGGSTAFGSGAPSQDKTIGSLLNSFLESRLSQETGLHYEVFTFANPAWASTQERIAIENYLSELQPDLVVSLSGNNDVFWGDAGRNVLWFAAGADEYFQTLASTGLKTAGRKELAPLPHVRAASQPVAAELVSYRLEKNARLGAQALQHVKAEWIFFLQPTLSVTRKPLSAREQAFVPASKNYFVQCYALMSSKLAKLQQSNFSFVDLTKVFDGYQATDEVFLDQFHFGDKGNAVIAEAMFSAVASHLEGRTGAAKP